MKQTLKLPSEFVRRIGEVFGEAGTVWLSSIPSLTDQLSARWGLVVGSSFELSYSYVTRARRSDGSEVVLKLTFPNEESWRQIAALRLYDGRGACRLIEADNDHCAMLLERLRPGQTLTALAHRDDEAATRIGAATMRQLWRPAPQGSAFRPLAEWFQAFDRHRARYTGAVLFPQTLFDRAEALARELLESADAAVLLHGDLHHHNILGPIRPSRHAIRVSPVRSRRAPGQGQDAHHSLPISGPEIRACNSQHATRRAGGPRSDRQWKRDHNQSSPLALADSRADSLVQDLPEAYVAVGRVDLMWR